MGYRTLGRISELYYTEAGNLFEVTKIRSANAKAEFKSGYSDQ
jgi:hypothetical protein